MTETRQIDNIGDPLVTPDGALLPGVLISFILVGWPKEQPIVSFIVDDKSMVAGTVSVRTDAQGEFTVDLIPNDLISPSTEYLCKIQGVGHFLGVLESGVDPKKFADFFISGNPLTIPEFSVLQSHLADTQSHLSIDDRKYVNLLKPVAINCTDSADTWVSRILTNSISSVKWKLVLVQGGITVGATIEAHLNGVSLTKSVYGVVGVIPDVGYDISIADNMVGLSVSNYSGSPVIATVLVEFIV